VGHYGFVHSSLHAGGPGRLFQLLAFTKTFAMFFAALLSMALVPV
jgi:Cu/Ag efflux pump CusA